MPTQRPTDCRLETVGWLDTRAKRRIGRRSFLRFLFQAASLGSALGIAGGVWATEDDARPSFSREAYEQALQAIPLRELPDAVRAKISSVVQQPTIYRRLPVEAIECDPELYTFLVRYPEVVVNIWQLMGVTRVQIRRVAPYVFDADDGAGTQSRVELLYASREKHLLYANGFYEGPLLKRRVTGRCVLLLQSSYSTTAEERPLISSRLDLFVSLDNVGAELVAKTLHPLVGKTADHNFQESMRFVAQMSQQAELNAEGMQRLAMRLDRVEESVRRQFATVAEGVGQRAVLRVASADASTPRAMK